MIINSLLDNDIYKFYMQQAVYHQFPSIEVEYEFKCRSIFNYGKHFHSDISFGAPTRIKKIKKELFNLCKKQFKPEEISYLRTLNIFQEDFLCYLQDFQLSFNHLLIESDPFKLKIKGPWLETILFETPTLAIISEIYNKKRKEKLPQAEIHLKTVEKMILAKDSNIKFADFGTRRRHSFIWQSTIVGTCSSGISDQFIGTSNVLFAMKYGLKPIGTMAHEWLMAGTSLAPSLRESQKFMLRRWLDIALTDVINMDAFLEDFKEDYLGLSYSGCRHDSGDPYEWGEKLIMFYKRWGIDPMSKTAVFSDGLTFPRMIAINNHFRERIKCMFGIGTNLTNDVGIDPLQIVIKMTKCDGKPVAKISDTPGKGMCRDDNHLRKLKEAFRIS
jgi:nicotinate phosphoribosyltransferase